MKSARIILAALVFISMAGLAYVAQQIMGPGTEMVAAADKFLATLTADQKARAVFAFDSDERTNWNFIPLQDTSKKATRKGLRLADMTADQKKAALALLKAGTSETGDVTALTIMTLEDILREQEATKPMNVRDPGWYFVTIFGTPAKTGRWGWRIEGHHLSLNFTMDGVQVVSSTPSFFGSNPAEIKGGPNKGKRILAPCEDLAFDLFKSLDADQKKTAHQATDFKEPGQKQAAPKLDAPVGLVAGKMSEAQRDLLWKLLKSYTDRWPAAIADTELKRVKDAGLDKVYFAFSGAPELGKEHTYRVRGPTFVIEFLNIQEDAAKNAANHIHSCWRAIKGDFGMD